MCPPADIERRRTSETASSSSVPIIIPIDEISQAAYPHAASHLHPDILAHSIRVFFLAKHLAAKEISSWALTERLPLLLTACIFHDIGTCDTYDTAPVRFEIQGADAARTFLAGYDVAEQDLQEVWNAIALHDTPQVAERIPGLVRIVRLAVQADFKNPVALALVEHRVVLDVEKDFPRGRIEKVLGDAVVHQAFRYERPEEKAPRASWPGELLRAKLADPEWEGVNKGF